jgi:hypothetical protein
MHFRAARAARDAREPYRRERGLLLQGALIVRDDLRTGPTCLCARPDLSEQHVGPSRSDLLLRKVKLVGMAR